MLIQLVRNDKREGYLTKEHNSKSIVAPFFAGANVAMRKKVFEDVGLYDPQCLITEDADICIRVGNSKWELYKNYRAIAYHKNPVSLRRMIKQWSGYTAWHSYLYKKHNQTALEIFAFDPLQREVKCVFYKRFPFSIVLIKSNFVASHLMFVAGALSLLLGWSTIATSAFFVGAFFLVRHLAELIAHFIVHARNTRYFAGDTKLNSIKRMSLFVGLSYIQNLTVLVSGIIGGLRRGILFVYGDPYL